MAYRTHIPQMPSPLRFLSSQQPPSAERPDENGACFIQKLPNELLHQIFSYLESDGRPTYLLRVCTQWQRPAEAIIFENQSFSDLGTANLERRIPQFLTCLWRNPHLRTYVKSIRFELPRHDTNVAVMLHIAKILELCQGIRRLSLRHSFSQCHHVVMRSITNLNQLEDLEITGDSARIYLDVALQSFQLPNIRRLRLCNIGPEISPNPDHGYKWAKSNRFPDPSQLSWKELCPPHSFRRSKVSDLSLDLPSCFGFMTEYLSRLPNSLTSISLTRLEGGNFAPLSRNLKLQETLNFHSESLQKITLGLMRLRRLHAGNDPNVPSLSNFPSLEEVTISAHNIFEITPLQALQRLQPPNLRILTVSYLEHDSMLERPLEFTSRHASWLKEFAQFQDLQNPNSKFSKISIDYRAEHTSLWKHTFEMPVPWPWSTLDRACVEVTSAGNGRLAMVQSQTPFCTEREWRTLNKRSILEYEHQNLQEDDCILKAFRRRRIANGSTAKTPGVVRRVVETVLAS